MPEPEGPEPRTSSFCRLSSLSSPLCIKSATTAYQGRACRSERSPRTMSILSSLSSGHVVSVASLSDTSGIEMQFLHSRDYCPQVRFNFGCLDFGFFPVFRPNQTFASGYEVTALLQLPPVSPPKIGASATSDVSAAAQIECSCSDGIREMVASSRR
jgi:hypothetical protein